MPRQNTSPRPNQSNPNRSSTPENTPQNQILPGCDEPITRPPLRVSCESIENLDNPQK